MSEAVDTRTEEVRDAENEKVLKLLAAAAFLVFVNGYMVAPLIPALVREFSSNTHDVGLLVPAYMLPYGLSTLFYGPLSDRIGRSKVLIALLAGSIVTSFLISQAWSIPSLTALRILAGLCAGGIVPISLALVGDLYPYQKLGRAMGWMFGAIAGGVACGAAFGAMLNASLGWRKEFMVLSAANAAIFLLILKFKHHLGVTSSPPKTLKEVVLGYSALLSSPRGSKTYPLIFLNAIFHSGLFTWISLYLFQRFQLSDIGIGQALLGYGIPGMVLGPFWGRLADRFGRRFIVPSGFLVASACAFLLIPSIPLRVVTMVIISLSIGFDMTHPLMSGIIVAMDPKRRGQAMGLNAFAVFTGFGSGAILFQLLLSQGFNTALCVFGTIQMLLSLVALGVFRSEKPAPVI